MTTSLRLRPVRADDETVARAAHALLAEEDFTFLLGLEERTWPQYLDLLRRFRDGPVPPGWVSSVLLLAEVDGVVVGRTSVRFVLNESLSTVGGHIGYAVLPAHRRRGYATTILRQSLVVARAHGVDRVLLTCHVDNHASARAIEACGGVFESITTTSGGASFRRYWID